MSSLSRLHAVPESEGAGRLERVSPFLVVVGTDTGVGKTLVAAALARTLTQLNLRVVAVKPVETGCGVEVSPNEDGAILASATGQCEPRAALIRLRAPVTPALAAEEETTEIDFPELVNRVRVLAAGAHMVVVETAGGLFSPITWRYNALDMIQALEARVLLVVGNRLGAINHAALTLSALGSVEVPGVVFSDPEIPDRSADTNLVSTVRHCVARGIVDGVNLSWRWVELPHVIDFDEASRHLDSLAVRLAEDLGLV